MARCLRLLLLCHGLTSLHGLAAVQLPASSNLCAAPLTGPARVVHIRSLSPAAKRCAVHMSLNSTRPVDPVEAAKAAKELQQQRVRLARQKQEEAQREWQAKQDREAQQRAQAQARLDNAAQQQGYGLSTRQPAVPMTSDARRRPGRTVRNSFLGVCV